MMLFKSKSSYTICALKNLSGVSVSLESWRGDAYQSVSQSLETFSMKEIIKYVLAKILDRCHSASVEGYRRPRNTK